MTYTPPPTSEVGDVIRELWQENPHLDYSRMEGLALQVDDLWRRSQEHRHCEKGATPRHPDRDPLDSDFGPHDYPELQIHISAAGMEDAAGILYQRLNRNGPEVKAECEQVAHKMIAAALASPPIVTEQTLETLVRALLATYPDHRWDGIKLRQMVEGLLLSLGITVEEPKS